MKMIPMTPPGTICLTEALLEMIRSRGGGKTFLEVGCGDGELSLALCRLGYRGTGIDISSAAFDIARRGLAPFLDDGRFQLLLRDILHGGHDLGPFDLGISMMVMEHVADDVSFAQKIASFVRPGGHVLLGVPGRKDRWNYEDDVVGHLRRYEREDLERVLTQAGLEAPEVWSVSVPVANVLFRLGSLMVRLGTEKKVAHQSQRDQTESSGIRRIPFKTVFPPWCRILLNRRAMFPFLLLQRSFYGTNLGLTLIGSGRVSEVASSSAAQEDAQDDE